MRSDVSMQSIRICRLLIGTFARSRLMRGAAALGGAIMHGGMVVMQAALKTHVPTCRYIMYYVVSSRTAPHAGHARVSPRDDTIVYPKQQIRLRVSLKRGLHYIPDTSRKFLRT